MKRLAFAALALLAAAAVAGAEEANIKVTSVVHPDGSKTDTITNFAERTSEERLVNQAGKVLRRTIFTLDDEGRQNGGVVYGPDNKPLSRFQFVRDAMGNIIEHRDYTVKGEVIQRKIYRLSGEGKVLGIDTYDKNGTLVHTTGKSRRK